MKHINYSFVMSTALVSVLLSGIGSAWAEENTEQPRGRKAGGTDRDDDPRFDRSSCGQPDPMNFELGPLGPVYLTGSSALSYSGRTILFPLTNGRSAV